MKSLKLFNPEHRNIREEVWRSRRATNTKEEEDETPINIICPGLRCSTIENTPPASLLLTNSQENTTYGPTGMLAEQMDRGWNVLPFFAQRTLHALIIL